MHILELLAHHQAEEMSNFRKSAMGRQLPLDSELDPNYATLSYSLRK